MKVQRKCKSMEANTLLHLGPSDDTNLDFLDKLNFGASETACHSYARPQVCKWHREKQLTCL